MMGHRFQPSLVSSKKKWASISIPSRCTLVVLCVVCCGGHYQKFLPCLSMAGESLHGILLGLSL